MLQWHGMHCDGSGEKQSQEVTTARGPQPAEPRKEHKTRQVWQESWDLAGSSKPRGPGCADQSSRNLWLCQDVCRAASDCETQTSKIPVDCHTLICICIFFSVCVYIYIYRSHHISNITPLPNLNLSFRSRNMNLRLRRYRPCTCSLRCDHTKYYHF